MKVIKTGLEGVVIVEPDRFGDHRGYFSETYCKPRYEEAGIPADFVQDNMSFSAQEGTLRGLHWQNPPYAQAKLVSVARGRVIDVAVDIRKGSPTFGQWHGELLTEKNMKQFYVPKGFAHGFLVLSEYAEFCYKCSEFYHPGDEGGLKYDDPEIGVQWPIPEGMELTLLERDIKWGGLSAYVEEYGR